MRKKKQIIAAIILIAMLAMHLPFQMVNAGTSGGFEYSVNGGKATITKYSGNSENVVIPEKLDGYEVCYIDNSAFIDQKKLKTVTFPNTLKSIAGFAFYGCEALEQISLPEGFTFLDINAFAYCKSLKYVTIPSTLEEIQDNVFLGCESLSNIEVQKNNVKLYSKNGVLFQKGKTGVNLYLYPAASPQKVYKVPDEVTAILDGAFVDARNLEKVYISNKVTEIETDAFDKSNTKLTICADNGSVAQRYAYEVNMPCNEEKHVPVTELIMSDQDICIKDKTQMTFSLQATIVPANASESVIRWISNDTSVATVENGVVTVKKNGLTIITAYCEDEYADCKISVEIPEDPKPTPGGDDNQNGGSDNQKPENNGTQKPENNGNQNTGNTTPTPDYKVSFKSQTYKVYATGKVKADLTSNMAGDGFKTVKSSNTAVAKVDNNGTITGVKKGTAVITATTKSGKTITAKVSVITPAVKLNASNLPLQLKKSTTALKVKSKLATDSIVQWKSTNPKVAAVDKKTGKITAKKKGTTYVSVTMKSGAVAKCKISVQVKAVETTKLTVNAKAKTLKLKGGSKTFQIKVTKAPITSLQKVTYKSSKKSVATVSGTGKITAKKAGNTTITVKAGKKTAKIKITVKKK